MKTLGEEVILPCVVSGEPQPSIRWRKDAQEIDFYSLHSDHSYMLEDDGSLFIPMVTVVNAGEFECIAENSAGYVTKQIELVVHSKSKPSILKSISILKLN